MTATERMLDAFAGLGFVPEPAGPGFDTDAMIGQIPGNGAAFIYAVDDDGESTGYPRAGTPCCVETYDHDANMGERTTFPDPVTAFVYVRDVSGWFAPLTATGERDAGPQRYNGSPVCSRCGWTHPAGSGPCGESPEPVRIENGFWDKR